MRVAVLVAYLVASGAACGPGFRLLPFASPSPSPVQIGFRNALQLPNPPVSLVDFNSPAWSLPVSYTVEVRVRGTGANMSDKTFVVLSVGSSAVFELQTGSSSELQVNRVHSGTTCGVPTAANGSISLSTAANHHLAITVTSTNTYFFLDGILESNIPEGGLLCSGIDTLRVGANMTPALPFDGIIDEVRISAPARYTTTNFTPSQFRFEPDATTLALIHFDDALSTVDYSSIGLSFLSQAGTPTLVTSPFP